MSHSAAPQDSVRETERRWGSPQEPPVWSRAPWGGGRSVGQRPPSSETALGQCAVGNRG